MSAKPLGVCSAGLFFGDGDMQFVRTRSRKINNAHAMARLTRCAPANEPLPCIRMMAVDNSVDRHARNPKTLEMPVHVCGPAAVSLSQP